MSRLRRLILDQVGLPGCPGGVKYPSLQGVRHLLYLLGLKDVLSCHAAAAVCGLQWCVCGVFSMRTEGGGEKKGEKPPWHIRGKWLIFREELGRGWDFNCVIMYLASHHFCSVDCSHRVANLLKQLLSSESLKAVIN